MKIIVVGDIHFRAKKLDDILNAWNGLVSWASKNEIDAIVQTGDVFDHANVYGREATTGTIYKALLSPLVSIPKPIPMHVVIGNHDLGSPRDADALAPIDKYDFINVIRKPGIVDINDEICLCAVPWVNKVHLVAKMISQGKKLSEANALVSKAVRDLMGPLSQQVKAKQDAGKFVLFVGHLEVTGASREGGTIQNDGAFEFAAGDLLSVGADAYALGHIHLRQRITELPNPNDGYLGTLCQLSFGEEANKVGCRLLEIEGRKIVTDKWLDNKNSPRYLTVPSLEGVNYRKGVDYVKLKSQIRPDEIPEGVQFEKVPVPPTVRQRFEGKLSCDLDFRTLLSAWAKADNCRVDVDLLVAQADELYRNNPAAQAVQAVGSLDRVDEFSLENIARYKKTKIKANFTGACGVAGPNGVGKTTAMESIMVSLYGISPKYPTLSALMPKNAPKGATELHFQSQGKGYYVRREFKNGTKFSQSANVFAEGSNEPLAGPGVESVDKFITNLIGDPDLVLAGVFSAQGDTANLIKLKPSQRKDLFAKLLGTERFFVIGKAAEKLASADVTTIAAQRSRIETLKIELTAEQTDVSELARLNGDLLSTQTALKQDETLVETYSAQVQTMSAGLQAHQNALAQIAALEKKRDGIRANGVALKQRRAELESLKGEQIEKELEQLKGDQARLAEVQEEIDGKLAEARKIEAQANSLLEQAAQKFQDRAKAYSAYLVARNSERAALSSKRHEEHTSLMGKMKTVQEASWNAANAISAANANANRIADKNFPNLDACRKCPLASQSVQDRDKLPELEADAAKKAAKVKAGETYIAKFVAETDKLLKDFDAGNTPEGDWQPEVKTEVASLKTEAATLKQKAGNVVPKALLDEKNTLKVKVEKIKTLEDQLKSVASAKKEIAEIDARLDEARKNFKEIEQEIAEVVVPEFDNQKLEQMKSVLAGVKSVVANKNSVISGINMSIGKCQAKIEQHDVRRKEISKIEGEIKNKAQKVDVLEALGRAFGRDGIPQMIVDSTVPHLMEIMQDLMTACDGKWSISIATQKETKSGTTQERIEILVDDGVEERDISTYSGGETNILAIIIRVAFSILQAERSGRGLKVLVLDEATYYTDNENTESFVRLLKKLPKYFNQIFVASHDDYVLASMPNKIFFKVANNDVKVDTDYTQ